MHDGFLECINVENSRPRTLGWKKIGGSWKASLVRDFYGWLVGVQVMSVSLAVTPLILLIFSTEFSMSSSWLKPLNEATTSNSPGIRWASTRFGKVFSFWSTVRNLPLTLTSAKASGGSEDSCLFLALVTFSMENAVWVDVMPVMLLIFSTVLNALIGSLVLSLITRSKRPVTGVTDSMLLTRLSWLTMCPSSPLAFAKTKLVDADLDIFL